ncbi:MAG: nucleoside deaminase [Clostridia bacterium]|nr:nucleoside deaminase [Clostridia bacterium]
MGYDKKMMDIAFRQAQLAYSAGEVPIGAVVCRNGEVVARAKNAREKTQSAIGHAELIAIKKACEKLKSWRLDDCELYVTVEPCLMCLGAAMNARIPIVYFGAFDYNGSVKRLVGDDSFNALNANVKLIKAEGEERCAKILTEFFSARRVKSKNL